MVRGSHSRAPECCLRQFCVDNHNVSFVLTLHERRQNGIKNRFWQLTVQEDDENVLPDRVMNRILHAFFGHSECAVEPPQETYPYDLQHAHIRTFVSGLLRQAA